MFKNYKLVRTITKKYWKECIKRKKRKKYYVFNKRITNLRD